RARRRPDADRLVGVAQVQEVAIGLGVHRDRLDAELLAGAHDPQGDLPAVRDQDASEHVQATRITKRGWPNSTGSPFCARISTTSPCTSALISFMTFIASRMQSVESGVTRWPTSTYGAASGDAAR